MHVNFVAIAVCLDVVITPLQIQKNDNHQQLEEEPKKRRLQFSKVPFG